MLSNDDALATHLRQLEEHLFDPAIRRDRAALLSLLAPGFREFGSSGRTFTFDQIVSELVTESSRSISLSDFRCDAIAPTVALVTYRSATLHPSAPTTHSLRSSIWIYSEAHWQVRFHQGTRITSPDVPPQ